MVGVLAGVFLQRFMERQGRGGVVAHGGQRPPGHHHDFGCDILPSLVKTGRGTGTIFPATSSRVSPPWANRATSRDVGTIESYYEANMDLKNVVLRFNLYNWEWSMVSQNYPDPPSKLVFDDERRRGTLVQSIMSSGCVIAGGFVKDCVLDATCG